MRSKGSEMLFVLIPYVVTLMLLARYVDRRCDRRDLASKTIESCKKTITSFKKALAELDPLRGSFITPRNLTPDSTKEQLLAFAINILREEAEFEIMRLDTKNVSHGMLAMKSKDIEFCQEQFREMWAVVQDFEVFDPPIHKKWFFDTAPQWYKNRYEKKVDSL